jgi:hypothetical protein
LTVVRTEIAPWHYLSNPACNDKNVQTTGKIMKLHLISGAVLVYTLIAMAAICLSELGPVPQNMAF